MSGPSSRAKSLLEAVDKNARKLRRLTILMHDHPDPDAMASAWALAVIVQHRTKVKPRIAYGGAVGRRENLVMLESLFVPAAPLRNGELEGRALALVDTQPSFKNNRFPKRRRPDLVIDHHPRHAQTKADYVHIDESVGATSTILVEALIASGARIPARLATALVYGIASETQNLGREAGARDRAAYLALLPKANLKLLWRIANPPRPASFFHNLARGINNAFVCRRVIGVHLREIFSPDRVAAMADFLLTHEKMMWSIVTGRFSGRLHVSLRTHSQDEHAGKLLKRILGGKNRAGGHRMIAGGSIGVGEAPSESKWLKLEEQVLSAFLKTRGVNDSSQKSFPFRFRTGRI